MNQRPQAYSSRRKRRILDRSFVIVCVAAASMSIVALTVLIGAILYQGMGHLDWAFLTGSPSRSAEKAGMLPAMVGSIYACVICASVAIPLGIGTAILLEEYRPKNRWLAKAHQFIQLNITNLAGVPSVVYGILGLTAFVSFFGVSSSVNEPAWEFGVSHYDEFFDMTGDYVSVPLSKRSSPTVELREGLQGYWGPQREMVTLKPVEDPARWKQVKQQFDEAIAALTVQPDAPGYEQAHAAAARPFAGYVRASAQPIRTSEKAHWYVCIPFGRGVLAGGMTLMLVVLPIIIISSQESLRAVPNSLRHGTLALGCTRWQMVWKMTLPSAIPGIMTGSILAMSRAIGEAAPILIIAGIVYITFTPEHLMDDFTAMPLQIFDWAGRPQTAFHHVAASGIIVLLAVLLSFNALAVIIRQKTQKPLG
ncbi:MAG: phosphate ABC transporter permease PstA [Phycisphaeraceae bacterium]|nr:phosphate ABC transporter permease PstA [Phycisphaeraceae bacterium]